MTTSTEKTSKTPDVIKFDHRPFSENGPRGATVKAEFRCHGQTFSFAIQSEDTWLTKLTGQLDDIKRVSVCPKGKNNVSLYFAGGDFYINVPDQKQQSEIVSWWQQVLEDLC